MLLQKVRIRVSLMVRWISLLFHILGVGEGGGAASWHIMKARLTELQMNSTNGITRVALLAMDGTPVYCSCRYTESKIVPIP